MNIKNVFFDFNGTILDDLALTFDIEDKMLRSHGLKTVDLDFYLNNFGFPVKDYYAKIGYDVSGNNYKELSDEFFNQYTSREDKETGLFLDTVETLKKLKKGGYNLYILTATEENMLINQLKRLGILEYFDGFAACKNFEAKGKIDYGRDFIIENKIKPDETVLIGDTTHDFEVAKALNLKPLLFSKGHNAKDLLKKYTSDVFDSYNEIYDYIISQNN